MSTIRDVAERAGVSTMTVSRVINNSGYISQEARERVEAAIAEIGYVPNTLARSLRFKQTKTLALVLTDITNPFFTTLARGAEDVASEQGFNVIFCNTDESESEQAKELTALVQNAWMACCWCRPPVQPRRWHFCANRACRRRAGSPRAGLHGGLGALRFREGRLRAGQAAAGSGHTRIAALSGPRKSQRHRIASPATGGRCRAGSGLTPRSSSRPVHSGRRLRDGEAGTGVTPRPTAFLAANNFIAVGAYQAVREAGLQRAGRHVDRRLRRFADVAGDGAFPDRRRSTRLRDRPTRHPNPPGPAGPRGPDGMPGSRAAIRDHRAPVKRPAEKLTPLHDFRPKEYQRDA